jgi:GTP-binding protein
VKFIDECTVRLVAGDGGNGAIAFRREKYIPHGGPAGGDGGRGGDVVFVGDPGRSTLYDLVHMQTLRAERGDHGQGKDRYGRSGSDLSVRVPVGTQGFDLGTGAMIFDVVGAGERVVAARGGRGGRGNIHFATAYDRAPRRAEPGEPGETKTLRLELKVLADAGLLGFPNVGKSTFIRAVSRARPKVAEYPFTTLVPHLGVVAAPGARSGHANHFVVADIPGLVPGASEGTGLGIRFLKHLERTRVFLHIVSIDLAEERDPVDDYAALRAELAKFDPQLCKRPEVVALSKADLFEVSSAYPALRKRFKRRKVDLLLFSAATGAGVAAVVSALWNRLGQNRADAAP